MNDEDITEMIIDSRDVEDKNFKQQYLQKTITSLTEENLDKLKKHCNKAIHYERGIEHKVVLELLQKYKEYLAEREADKKRIKELEEENADLKIKNNFRIVGSYAEVMLEEILKNDYIPKQKVKEILDRLHISDIEPWSTYKVSGDVLFDLKGLLEDK